MKQIISLALSAAALAYSPAASAAEFVPTDPEFQVFGDGTTGSEPVDAVINRLGLTPGSFTDNFRFRIGPMTGLGIGLGSGTVTTSFSGSPGTTFTSVKFNNGVQNYNIPIAALASGFSATIGNIPIFSGNLNTLSVGYTVVNRGSYGGQLTYIPGGIPEPMTWAMMIIGFAAVGFAMRRRNEEVARVRYAF